MTRLAEFWYGFACFEMVHPLEDVIPMSCITLELLLRQLPASKIACSKVACRLIAAGTIALSIAYALPIDSTYAMGGLVETVPEVTSKVWLENGQQLAAVTINGEEVARFKAGDDSDKAIEEAEELAIKLHELLSEKKFDASSLLPARDEDKASIKHEGSTVISFNPFAGVACDEASKELDKKRHTEAFETSLRICNAIRTACGINTLPSAFPDVNDKSALIKQEMLGHSFSGHASWYGGKFNGRRCSNGSIFSEEKMTAAHKTLPFGTKLLVKNRRTGDTCIVEVNDRGPFVGDRIIDLSKAAARQLNMVGSGVALVDCLIIAQQQ